MLEHRQSPVGQPGGAAQDPADAVTVDAAMAARETVRLRIESGALAQDSRCVSVFSVFSVFQGVNLKRAAEE